MILFPFLGLFITAKRLAAREGSPAGDPGVAGLQARCPGSPAPAAGCIPSAPCVTQPGGTAGGTSGVQNLCHRFSHFRSTAEPRFSAVEFLSVAFCQREPQPATELLADPKASPGKASVLAGP